MFKQRLSQKFSSENSTVVGLGDSLTEGWLEEKGYFDFIGEWLRSKYPFCSINLVNRGVPGDTSSGGLHRLQKDVINHKPDLVFIQYAINDFFLGISLESYSKNIEEILHNIQENTKAEAILITSVPLLLEDTLREAVERFYHRLIKIGHKHSIAVANVHDYWKKKLAQGANWESLVQSDGVHPTVAGYQLMAEAIWELFT